MAALPANQSVEVVEVTWKILNFLAESTENFNAGRIISNKRFFIGGRVRSADKEIESTLPIKVQIILVQHLKVATINTETCHLKFKADALKLPSNFTVTAKLMDLKISSCENTLEAVNEPYEVHLSFHDTNYEGIKLFNWSEIGNHVDREDQSLTICFKLEFTFVMPNPTTGNFVTADGWDWKNDLESFMKYSRIRDVEIKVSQGGGKSFHCHQVILLARSKVFRSMFERDVKKVNGKVVKVDDMLPVTMGHLISFLYCERFQDSSWVQSLPQLAYAADKYFVKSLKNFCDSKLILCVTTRNAVALRTLAEGLELMLALKDIDKFIAENAKQITSGMEVDLSATDGNLELIYSYPESFVTVSETTRDSNLSKSAAGADS